MRAAAQPRLLRLRGRERPERRREAERPVADAERDAPRGAPGNLPLLVALCVAAAGLSLLFAAAPTYDPWAWLLWGREIVELDLSTRGGPSWKPLPVLFTAVFSLFGEDAAPLLWLVVARAGALLACVMCFRVAWRLAGGGVAGVLGGVAAALLLLTGFNFVRDAALGNSEALMLALVLAAFERHLDGRRDHALLLGVAAALLRPEVWPFLGVYGLFLLVREPALRLRTALLGMLVPVLWFGPELWGSSQALRAATRANDPNRGSAAFADNPTMALLERFGEALVTPVKVGAAVAVAVALVAYVRRRHEGAVLAVFLGGCAWFALVAAMTEAGYAGNQRYLIVTLGAFTILAGVGGARALQLAAATAERLTGKRWAAALAVAAISVAVAAVAVPVAVDKEDSLQEVRRTLRYDAALWGDLEKAIAAAGGKERLKACGGLYSGPYQTQMVAYELGVHGEDVRSLEGTPPPGAAFRTRTTPSGPLVIKLTDPRYRRVARVGKWRVLTVPPDGRSACPAAGRNAPRVLPGGRTFAG